MPSSLRSRALKTSTRLAAAAIAVAAASTMVSVVPAHAIGRGNCNDNNYLKIFSSSTTCWGGAGGTSVYLAGTVGASPGNNSGFVKFPSNSDIYFTSGGAAKTWSSRVTNYIAIY